VPGDTNGRSDVFVRDRQAGTTQRVSLGWTSGQGNGNSFGCSISADGRFVVFESEASNLVPMDSNGVQDVFVRDRQSNTTERMSVSSDSVQGNDRSLQSSISFDGRYVAFSSVATNLVPGDTNGKIDVFVHDRLYGITKRISESAAGVPGNDYSYLPRFSGDGRYVSFESAATNLVPGDTNQSHDVFLHDRRFGTTERVNLEPDGSQGHFS
jgi:Tol biopolymer transport system component